MKFSTGPRLALSTISLKVYLKGVERHTVSSTAKDKTKASEGGEAPSGVIRRQELCKLLHVSWGMLLAQPRVKHGSLNILHSPQTQLPLPRDGNCQTSNSIPPSFNYGEKELCFSPQLISSAGGSCCGEGKKEGISLSGSSPPGVTGNTGVGGSYKSI